MATRLEDCWKIFCIVSAIFYYHKHSICIIENMIAPSVLWCCWLGGRKGIRPVNNWVVGCRRGYLSVVRCRIAYSPADATATHRIFASVKSRFVLPLWYRLTRRAVKRVCVCSSPRQPNCFITATTVIYLYCLGYILAETIQIYNCTIYTKITKK